MDTINEIFSVENLRKIYDDNVSLSFATGIDNLSQKAFYGRIDEELNIINKKVMNGSYKFTNYKLKLISKGRAKVPREISVPTIRDRITLRAVCNYLLTHTSHIIKFELPQDTIRLVKADFGSNNYVSFMKLDVESFYPSIKHDYLIKVLRDIIEDESLIKLVEAAISTPTVIRSTKTDSSNKIGVPQGLSISNILAALYLIEIDKKLSSDSEIKFYRYVDDILVFTKEINPTKIYDLIRKDFEKIGLTVHEPHEGINSKSKLGGIGLESFDYLGYKFSESNVTVRNSSFEKIKESLVSIFTGYKYSKIKSKEFLLWRLNLRITGCVFEAKTKGWLFFFSEIDDEKILHILDIYIENLVKRFNVIIRPKKFVRAFYEIKHNKYHSNYIPNFDSYTLDQMKAVLIDFFKKDINKLSDEEVRYEFRCRIQRQAKDLLADLQIFGGSG